MAITVYHHPFSRAAGTLWMLEEAGVDYELRFVDILKGEQKDPSILALNPMGKLPTMVDGEVVVTENAAIGLYLADRYAPALAPKIDAPERATYYRWSVFAPSVIEPASMAKGAGWAVKEGQAGWGNYEAVLKAIESALQGRDFLLGKQFSMADVIFGGTLRYMLSFGMMERRPLFTAYAERLGERPALKRAEEKNAAIVAERGIRT
jgi:glutathione S-transferase